MPEHQQTQKSTESKTTSQRQATPRIQAPSSHPMAIIQRARINPKSLTPADVMQLQQTIGNRAVVRLLTEIGAIPSKVKQAPPVQRQELVQRHEISEEEEPLQGKFESGPEKETCPSCMQRQEIPEEEEPLQGKMIGTIQRQEIPEEEEPLQGKFENKPEIACPSCLAAPIVQRREIPEEEEPVQTKRENNTGMPDNLKAGVENLSGIDMSDVRVHYNSSKPANVGALAYTQGANIHVAPGQEKHLPHEAWHVVQQAQGRVKPTMQMKDMAVNDDAGLEHEADVIGNNALQLNSSRHQDEGKGVSPVHFICDHNFNNNIITRSPSVTQQHFGNVVMQLKLPLTLEEYYRLNKTKIDILPSSIERTSLSKDVFKYVDFCINVLKPFLENRKDLVINIVNKIIEEWHILDSRKNDFNEILIAFRDNGLKPYAKSLNISNIKNGEEIWDVIYYHLFSLEMLWKAARVKDWKDLVGVSGTRDNDALIRFADSLPEMYNIPESLGGYEAVEGLTGMPKLQKTLTNLGNPVTGDNIPVITKDVFMKSQVPEALKRLVNDIYLFWKVNAVLDTRTDEEKAQQREGPTTAGSLRSWHMNAQGSLPAIPAMSATGKQSLFHIHYAKTSKNSKHPGEAPIGYAEYTGIDAHDNKIVLDYVRGNIFVTAMHYSYWHYKPDMPEEKPQGLPHKLAENYEGSRTVEETQIHSPWVKIEMR